MKRLSYWAEAYVSPLFLLLITITVLMIGASDVFAYDDYAGGCDNCHGGFTEGSYTSLVDGGEWTGGLHNVHRNGMLGGDCDTCHTGNSFDPVFLESSNGGSGLSPISCVGCHGRDEDDGNATTTGTSQRGAGLRQHHVGHASCAGCHDDQTGYTPVGEDILPNYYAFPGTGHPSMPTDSCNPNGSEGVFGGTLLGLDNDGNDTYDTADPACAPVGCQSDAECDNGAFCDSVEICDLASGVCQACTPVNVDDGVSCTDDSCDEANNTIVNAPNDGLCDNGAFCDGSETCDTINDCQAGTPPCDPATETCDEVGDVCELIGCQSDAECDNGAFCDGVETCDLASGVCQAGTPVNVDDGVSCTDDDCDEANNTVVNAPNDGLCDNGMFCDGSETCDVVSDCQPGTPPCDSETETCDEVGDICELIPTPDVLDLDLASLQVTKRVRLARVKPVALKLVVNNNGTVEGTAIATITGEQNSVTVYFETLTVTDGVGKGRTTYSDKSVPPVPSFVPYTEGDILWKVTIDDDDVDLDEITAVTKVTQ